MPQVGDIINHYRQVRQIGEGGMGAVFEAVHTKIRSKRAAVKLLLPSLTENPETIARFEREAEAASAIGHEAIIDIYDLGVSSDGTPYMIMEFLRGRSLAAELDHTYENGPNATFDEELAVFVACNVLSALSATHAKGIVHRDLKPDNIFLVETSAEMPRVKLLDFGIARFLEPASAVGDGRCLTKTGITMGTPDFMSPEQAVGEPREVDHQSDIWAVGVILYLSLTDSYPYESTNYNQLVYKLISDFEPPAPSTLNPAITPALEQIILRAMRKDRNERYASAAEMLDALRPLASAATLSVLAISERHLSVPPREHLERKPKLESHHEEELTGHPVSLSQQETERNTSLDEEPASRPRKLLVGFGVAVLTTLVTLGVVFGLSSGSDDAGETAPEQPPPPMIESSSAEHTEPRLPFPTKTEAEVPGSSTSSEEKVPAQSVVEESNAAARDGGIQGVVASDADSPTPVAAPPQKHANRRRAPGPNRREPPARPPVRPNYSSPRAPSAPGGFGSKVPDRTYSGTGRGTKL